MRVYVVEHHYYKHDYGSWWMSVHAVYFKESDAEKCCKRMNKESNPNEDHYQYDYWDVE